MSLRMWTCADHGTHGEARGQLVGVSSFLPLCGFQGQNSGPQIRQQAPLLSQAWDCLPFKELSPLCNKQTKTNTLGSTLAVI